MSLGSFAVLMFVAVCLFSSSALQAGGQFYSYYDGKQYGSMLSNKLLDSCPRWNPQEDPSPPLAAGRALKTAHKWITTVKTSKETFWSFQDLVIVDFGDDRWAWRATYRLTLNEPSTGVWSTMQCWILMDGTHVKPKVRKSKPNN